MRWKETGQSSANSEVEVSHAGETGRAHYVTDLDVSISGASSGNDVEVTLEDSDDTVLQRWFIDSARGVALQKTFNSPIEGPPDKGVKVVVAAAGASAIASVNVGGYTARPNAG